MARPREFDTDTAYADAMNVFWEHGYEDTSLPQLLDGMSLSRGSFYKAFKTKRSLFISILQRYEKEAVAPAVALLKDAEITDGAERIENLFQLVMKAVKDGDYRGCLLCNTAANSAQKDDEIAGIVHRLLGDMRRGFEIAVDQSHAFKDRSAGEKKQVASLLLTQYVGLRVLVHSRLPIRLLEETVKSVLSIIHKSPNT